VEPRKAITAVRQQGHQRHRVQADLLHLRDGGSETEAARFLDQARALDQVLAQETGQRHDVVAHAVHADTEPLKCGQHAEVALGLGPVVGDFLDGGDQRAMLLAERHRVLAQVGAVRDTQQLQHTG
jgi:hypothetical protein